MLHHYFWCSKLVNVFFWSLASFAVISSSWIKHLRASTTYSCKWEGYISIADASILRASIYFRRNVLELAVSTSLNTLSFFLANLHPSVFAIILPFFFKLSALIKLRSICRSRAIRFVSSCLIGIKRCHEIHPTKMSTPDGFDELLICIICVACSLIIQNWSQMLFGVFQINFLSSLGCWDAVHFDCRCYFIFIFKIEQNWIIKLLPRLFPSQGCFVHLFLINMFWSKMHTLFLYVRCGSFFAAALSKCRHATQGAGTYILQGYTFILLCILWHGGRKLKF